MEIRIPEVGESVREALVAKWFKKDGERVKRDELLCEIETDKITLDINADTSGVLSVSVTEGTTVPVGSIIGTIADEVAPRIPSTIQPVDEITPLAGEEKHTDMASSPAVRRTMREQGIDPASVTGTGRGGRITLDDLFASIEDKSRRQPEGKQQIAIEAPPVPHLSVPQPQPGTAGSVHQATPPPTVDPAAQLTVHSEEAPAYTAGRDEHRPMSPIRKRIAERLVAVRQQTAMLTTFNEADLGQVKALRQKHKDHFQQRHGITLGYMSFFVKACVEALREVPAVNASLEGDDIVYHHYFDIGIAIGGDKGLVVPVLRNADRLKLYEIEQGITGFVEKIRTNRLSIADLEGGTFTISNGGVYGSMLSTPILNPPQSGVLGMHAVLDRPVAREGQVVIRPMMYLALSYDHRIIDGREAVGFLRKVKEYIEDPEELLLEG